MQGILNQLIKTTVTGQDDSDAHLMTLFGIALSLKARNILELGVRYGTTTLPLLLAARIFNGTLTSVDINPTQFHPPIELSSNWKFVQRDAIEFLKLENPSTNQYDLVLIDDWHSYGHVAQELSALSNLVTKNSVILLHDLMYGGAAPDYRSELDTPNEEFAEGGPYRAVDELDKDVWEWATIPVYHGLTILRKKV